ncbi:DUF2066 domain-containing protein [Ferrimonas marina]|nr:DUF2066 domain-containing protein [Ferrimonas marina]
MLPARAVTVADLFIGEVAVGSRSNQDRQLGVRDALAQVLVRNTGDSRILEQDAARAMIRQAESYLLSYGYRSGDDLKLQVRFDAQRIQSQLQQAQLPVWGAQRPQTLIWLAEQAPEGAPELVTDTSEVSDSLALASSERGVPVLMPLMDLEDNLLVSVNDVWGDFPEPVLEASGRYQPDFLLSGRLMPVGNQWQYQFALYSPLGNTRSSSAPMPLVRQSGQAADAEQAVSLMLADLARYYASRYASVAGESEGATQLVFEIQGGIESLVSLERYLESLAPIGDVQVTEIQGRTVTLALALVGGLAEVEQLLTLDARVEEIAPPQNEFQSPFARPLPEDGEELSTQARYRWQGR